MKSDAPATIVTNGPIHLMVDGTAPPEAIGFRAGWVAAVGSFEDVRQALGGRAEVWDLRGRALVPGFVESHAHPLYQALSKTYVDLRTPPVYNLTQALEALGRKAATLPAGEWIYAWGYDHERWPERRQPTAKELETAVGDHPCFLSHISGHLAVANTAAFQAAGLTDEQDPRLATPGVIRDGAGQLTGELREAQAIHLIQHHIPAPDLNTVTRLLGLAAKDFLAAGVTSVADMATRLLDGGRTDLLAYRQAMAAGTFPLRLVVYPTWEVRSLARTVEAEEDGIALGGIKSFIDGSIQAHTAALGSPYDDCPESGSLLLDEAELYDRAVTVQKEGLRLALHANGDRAITTTIRALARAQKEIPGVWHHRIEHAQMIPRDLLPTVAALGIQLSFFVSHITYWGDLHNERFLGPQRAARINPLASAKHAGIVFSLHSDSPITPSNPLESMRIAAVRRTPKGVVLGDEERIDVATALKAWTSAAATVAGLPLAGRLAPGYWADAVVLSEDPFRVPSDQLDQIAVEGVFLAGEWHKP